MWIRFFDSFQLSVASFQLLVSNFKFYGTGSGQRPVELLDTRAAKLTLAPVDLNRDMVC